MKAFFWFIFAVLVLAMMFLFGNALRCYSQRYVNGCPSMCLSKPVECDPGLVPDCATKFSCHAPDLPWYAEYIQNGLAQWRAKLQQK